MKDVSPRRSMRTPPIKVAKLPGRRTYILIDGQARLIAHRETKRKYIYAVVVQLETKDEILMEQVRANQHMQGFRPAGVSGNT